jgi:Fe-S-cluster-containing dehydrogenase component
MVDEFDKAKKAELRKATTCDLCSSLGPKHEPSCVYACPHDAAHRMAGPDLLALVRSRSE